MDSPSPLESLFTETADVPLTVGKRDLEKAFQSILEQLADQRRTSNTWSGAEGRNCGESCQYASRKCCCDRNENEMPSFSFSFSNPSCNARTSCCRTAGSHKKVLQIHLPESCKDPCQILITSHRDQVSVKYLQQGQQFTFSTSGSPASQEVNDRMFSNADSDSKTNERNANANHVRENVCFSNEMLGSTHSSINAQNTNSSVQNANPNLQNNNHNIQHANPNVQTTNSYIQNTNSNIQNANPNIITTNPSIQHANPNVQTTNSYIQNTNSNIQNANPNIITTNPSIQNANPLGIVIQDIISQRQENSNSVSLQKSSGDSLDLGTSTQKKRHLPEGTVEKPNDDYVVVSALNEQNISESSFLDIPPSKRQKKQSLNTFIDSLLDKRAREAMKKPFDDKDVESVITQETSLESREETLATCTMDEDLTFKCTDTGELTSSRLSTDALEEATTHSPGISNPSLVEKDMSPIATVISSLSMPAEKTVSNSNVLPSANKLPIKKGRFKCQYCNELFQQRSNCLLHISEQHVEERPHHCPLCDTTFKKRRSLKYHLRHHNGERPFKCTYCDKAFKEKYHLTVHIRTHTGERPFACTQCGKAFKQTNELTSHIRTHTGERPYKCNICDRWFKRRSQLYNHNLSHLPEHSLESVTTNDTGVASL